MKREHNIDGYDVCEYIKSTGTQYIDLGYVPKTNTWVETYISFSYDSGYPLTTNGNMVLGCADNDTWFQVNLGGQYSQYAQIFFWVYPYVEGQSQIISIDNKSQYNSKFYFRFGNGTATFGNMSKPLPQKPKNSERSMYIFGNNSYSGVMVFSAHKNMYLYDFLRIHEGTNLVSEYVPAVDGNGKAGMYDITHKRFCGNIGTGDFEFKLK